MTAKRDAPSPLRLLPLEEDDGEYGKVGMGGKMVLTVLLPSASASPSSHLTTPPNPQPANLTGGVDICLASDNTSSSAPSMATGPPTGPHFMVDESAEKQEPQEQHLIKTSIEYSEMRKADVTEDAMKTLMDCLDVDFPMTSFSKTEPEGDGEHLPKEDLISYLAHASEYRLLNPAFLLGIDLATPFLSSPQFDQLELGIGSEKEATRKGAESDYSSGPRRSFSSSSSSSSPPTGEVDRLGDIHLMELCEPLEQIHACDAALGDNFCDTEAIISVKLDHPANSVKKDGDGDVINGIENILLEPDQPQLATLDDEDNIALTTLIERLEAKKSPAKVVKEENMNVTRVPTPQPPAVNLHLFSAKMSSIAHLLSVPGRLNSSAIKLCLTAQSQVSMRRRPSGLTTPAPASPALKSIPG